MQYTCTNTAEKMYFARIPCILYIQYRSYAQYVPYSIIYELLIIGHLYSPQTPVWPIFIPASLSILFTIPFSFWRANGQSFVMLSCFIFERCLISNPGPTLQRKSHLCILFLGIARLQSKFPHSCACERFIYSQDLSTYFLQQKRQIDSGNIQISRRHINVEIGTVAAPFLFLGIFVSKFWYWFCCSA